MALKKTGFEPVYRYGSSLYVNLTNRCTNRCAFCLREAQDAVGDADSLWLEREPEASEVLVAWNAFGPEGYTETVFCGYGEPTERLDTLLEAARGMKAALPGHRIRLNTNGHADLIAGKPTAPLLAGLIDCVSVSLNAPTAAEYVRVCEPEDGEAAFAALLAFARDCKDYVPEVVLSIVQGTADEQACRTVAESLGLPLRTRASMT